MKSKSGIICMALGLTLMLGALFLYQFNRSEDRAAQQAAEDLMPQLMQQIQEQTAANSQNDTVSGLDLQVPVELLSEEDKKMTEKELDGNLYIGCLSIPKVGLDLPVMSSWSYPKLSIAPCRYAGSVRGEDLVLMAHNYDSHFGRLSRLDPGDSVVFTDMDGNAIYYEVVGEDVLPPNAVDELTSGDFDLTLFTCTYGGANRLTIYCNRV